MIEQIGTLKPKEEDTSSLDQLVTMFLIKKKYGYFECLTKQEDNHNTIFPVYQENIEVKR